MGKIVIVAFNDKEGNSVAYKKFGLNEIGKAVEFYRKQLENEYVHVVSTRKTT